MQIALYRKYRPGKFADLVGQEPIKLTLANQVKAGAVGHAYIFAGPKGTGKTTVARILAKAVNCLDPKDGDPCGKCALCVAADGGAMLDLIEIDGASNNGVDNIRELIERMYVAPSMGKYKVYVIDEAHMLTKPAFNALLKTLEEPPAHAIFILASTEIDKFPPTIISRCQRFDFRPIKLADVSAYLEKISKAEKIDITHDGLALIAEQSGGGMRDALSLLERAAAMGTGLDAQSLSTWFGVVGWNELIHLTELVVAADRTAALQTIEEAYRNGYDLVRLAAGWTNVVRALVSTKLGNVADLGLNDAASEKLVLLADKLTYAQLIWWLEEMLELSGSVKRAGVPQLPLEITALKVIEKIGNLKSEIQNDKADSENMQPPTSGGIAADEQEVVANDEAPVGAETMAQAADVDWDGVIASVKKQSPTLGAVLSGCKWSVVGGILIVNLTSRFYKEKLEQPASRELVAGALAGVGVELRVDYRLDESGQVSRSEVDPRLVSELFG